MPLTECQAPITLSGDGAGQSATGTCTERAGNIGSITETGRLVHRAPAFGESLTFVEAGAQQGNAWIEPESIAPLPAGDASVYQAIVMGVRDYVNKHQFPGAVLGLSGGVDSALVLAIACDALGADRVHAVMMPSRFTSAISAEDATAMARALGVHYSVISIEGMYQATLAALKDEFAGRAPDTTEENVQARCRGMLLMAISNKTGRMVLTTGNKSEMSVGYATLYGDMAGGFAVLKDVPKMLVYELAAAVNGRRTLIPQRVLDKAPTAELRPNQKDEDKTP